MQIRTRLTLSFFGIAACILAGLFSYVYWAYKHDAEDAFFQNLRSKAAVATQTLLHNAGGLNPMAPTLGNDDDTLSYRDNISLYNEGYVRVFSAQPDAPEVGFRILQSVQSGDELRFQQKNLQALARLVHSENGLPYVLVAEGYYDPTNVAKLRQLLIFSFFIGLLILLLTCWYFAGQALRPVARFMEQVNSLSPAQPERRIETEGKTDEIARLAETFNSMLDRVENAFRMQRMFLSNVSHELKNPLTIIRSQIEVALQREREPEAYRRALQSVLDDIGMMTEVEEKLLQLARLHNEPAGIPLEPVRLDELLWLLKEQLKKTHPAYQVVVEFQSLPEHENALVVNANEALLRSAILNLMINACKYSPDQRVLVNACFAVNGAHVVEIRDKGPGIPPEEIPLIFEPFYRSPRHRAIKGTGVGLSLVRSIMDLHHIAIDVSNATDGGAVFLLRFPAAG